MISLEKRLRYARAYVELGLVEEAAAELEAVDACDLHRPEYFIARVHVHLADHQWELVIRYARILTLFKPLQAEGWLAWAVGLRALGRTREARDVLVEAEPLHGESCAALHYHLSHYYRLLGDDVMAEAHRATALQLDPDGRSIAIAEPTLQGLSNGLL